MLRIIRRGNVFEGRPDTDQAKTCFPWLVQLSSGELLASFQTAADKNGINCNAALCRSADGGQTWGAPVFPFDGRDNGQDSIVHVAYLTELSPGKIIATVMCCDHQGDPGLEFFNPDTGGLLATDLSISFSEDYGNTWSRLQRVEKGDLEGTPTPAMGAIHDLGNGKLICPFETSKEYNDPSPWIHKAAYFISHDSGRTWPEYRVVASDPESRILYWDHRIAGLGSGKLVDFFWGYDNVNCKELNAYQSKTLDNGTTWSQPAVTEIVGQPWPIALDDDTFAVVAVDRNFTQTIKLYLTDDFGESFDAAEPLLIYHRDQEYTLQGELNEQLQEQMNWAYGLPSGIKLPNGNLMITWYAGDKNTTDVCYCEVSV